MKIAFILFNGLTCLDLAGVYDPISRLKSLDYLPDLEWDFCALTDTAEDPGGLKLLPSRIGGSLAGYDAIVVPGGNMELAMQLIFTPFIWRMMERRQRAIGAL